MNKIIGDGECDHFLRPHIFPLGKNYFMTFFVV